MNPIPDFIDDGLMEAKLRSLSGEERTVQYDPLLLLLTCEETENKHNLPKTADGTGRVATVAFLTELTRNLQDIGIAGCNPTLAVKLWRATSEAIDAVKKNTSETPSLPTGTASTSAE